MPNSLSEHVETDPLEFLTFLLNQEIYGLNILNIQEIHGYNQITKIETVDTGNEVRLNLRGKEIPVIDLRKKQKTDTYKKLIIENIIIVKAEKSTFALVVDGVSDVISISKKQILFDDTESNSSIDKKYIAGQFHIDENIVILIDIEKLTKC
jgi:purine-binding chemotaxis protein CheW